MEKKFFASKSWAIALLFTFACRETTTTPTEIDWHGLEQNTTAYLIDSAYEKIYELDSFVYNSPGMVINDLTSFTKFSLNCIAANFQSNHSDIYKLLRITEDRLQENSSWVQENDVLTLANYYLILGLYRRAIEALNIGKLQSDSIRFLRSQVDTILRRSETFTTKIVRTNDGKYTDGKSRVLGRLCDLLSSAPDNGWYSEYNLQEAGKTALFGNLAEDESSNSLFSFLTNPGKIKLQKTWEGAEDEYTEEYREEPNDSFVPFEVYSEENDLLSRLWSDVQLKPSSGEWIKNPVIKNIVARANSVLKINVNPDDPNLFNLIIHTNVLGIALTGEFEYLIVIIKRYEDDTYQVFYKETYDIESMQFVQAIAHGTRQLFVTTRSGSGGFVDAILTDMENMTTIFYTEALYHGGALLIDIDADQDLEVIITKAIEDLRIVDCNQCPARQIASVFDFNRTVGYYELVAETVSSSEILLNMHRGLTGMSAIMKRIGMEYPSGTNVYNKLEQIWKREKGKLSKNEVHLLWNSYRTEIIILEESKDFAHATSLSKNVLNLFRNGSIISEKHPDFYLEVVESLLKSLLVTSEFSTLHELINDSFYLKIIDTSQFSTAYNLHIRSLAYLQDGKYGNAFDHLTAGYKYEINDDHPASVGNLALYYSLVNDTASYYEYSVEAANRAVRSRENIALNFLHVARSGSGILDDEDRLDYMIRAIKETKGYPDGEQGSIIMQTASQIALDYDEPDIALKILHQAISFTTKAGWQQEGAYIMLLYSKCLQRLGRKSESINTLKTAAKLGKGISKEAYITACYELSKIYKENNSPVESFYYAQLGFDSVNSYRKTINELNHKFSFLQKKKEVVDWYFKFLLEQNTPAGSIFAAVESWKMRSFIDAYKEKGIYKEIEIDTSNQMMGKIIDELLTPSDLLLNFSISAEQSFVVVITRDGAKTIKLDIVKPEVDQLVSLIRGEMDINNPESLSRIRRDKVNAALKKSLAKLYNSLFAKIDIDPGITRLLIIPDESLYGIPWSALKIDGKSHLLDKYEVCVFPSALIAYAIMQNSAAKTESKKGVVIGSLNSLDNSRIIEAIPTLSNASGSISFERLKSGENEIKKVALSLREQGYNVRYLLDNQTAKTLAIQEAVNVATKENFIEELGSANILHCIAHGIFNPVDPMQSCLFLEPGIDNTSVIKPVDLIDLNMKNLSLVSLSACQSGINNLMPGAEPIGFLRSFLGAGTSHILLAEWEVDDKTVGRLFEIFYQEMNKQEITRALNIAKMELRKKYDHPYYWSGITLYGSPNRK